MNTKRQTVWLVSMLSLMVILSAYYLFTEDSGSSSMLTDAGQKDATETASGPNGAGGAQDDLKVSEVKQIGESGITKEEQDVLKKFEEGLAAASSDYFTQQMMARNDSMAKEYERLYTVMNDTNSKTEEAKAAAEELSLLEEKEAKITGIEEELITEFGKAVIAEENNKYKVVVQSEKLERSQADSILMLVMDTLDVTQDKVSVQYIP